MTWLWTLLWLTLAAPPARLDGPALEATLDTIVTDHITATGVPGVVVTVTAGDRIVVERGWGVADLDTGRPMDPKTTLVRIASLSKTFTATAVAQLEDAGRLDIDADVDQYLQRVSTAGPFEAPVTVRHLLAHTSGYINFNSGRVSVHPPRPEDFEAFIARTMPPRMHPPGTATLYTNHGNALAGLVVQDITGVAFSQYVHDSILAPLQMHSTVYDLDAHQPELSRSYDVADDGTVSPWPYEYFETIPASAVHTTAHDMASYLMLHAGDGRVHRRVVLSATAMERMRTPSPTIDAALGQYHYAFAPTEVHGRTGRAHGGSVPAFLSRMVVFDGVGVGVFVAQNAFGPNVATKVIEAVADTLPGAPSKPPPQPIGDGKPIDGARLAGEYRVLDKNETAAFTRPRAVLSQSPVRVALDGDGFLTVDGRQYERTGALQYQSQREDGRIDTIVFVAGPSGAIAWMHNGRTSAFRPPWHAERHLQLAAFGVAFLLLVGGWIRLPRQDAAARRLWSALAAAIVLGTLAPHVAAVVADRGQPVYTHPFRLGIPPWIPIVLWLPRVATVLSVAMLFRRELRHWPGFAVAAGGALLIALEQYWRTPPPGLPPA